MPKLPSHRNQSIDLQSKSIDWFLMRATLAFMSYVQIAETAIQKVPERDYF